MNKLLRTLIPCVAFAAPTLALAHNGVVHGDHDAQHGGFVMMYQDLHVELVMPPAGGVKLYYTDAARGELPAAVVSEVAVEIARTGAKTESVTMSVSAGGDAWEGKSAPLPDAKAMVHIAFLYNAAPVLFNVPAVNVMPRKPAAKAVAKPAAKPAAKAAAASGHDGH